MRNKTVCFLLLRKLNRIVRIYEKNPQEPSRSKEISLAQTLQILISRFWRALASTLEKE